MIVDAMNYAFNIESSIGGATGVQIPVPLLGEMPSGSVSLARLRQDFRETATWQPQLRTGADGIVRTTFRLPDSLTSYRLTAVALTKDNSDGSWSRTVTLLTGASPGLVTRISHTAGRST